MELIDKTNPNSTTSENWLKMRNNDSDLTHLMVIPESLLGSHSHWGPVIQDPKMKELGQDIANNTSVKDLSLHPNFYDETTPSPHEDEIERKRQNFLLICEGFHNNQSIEKLHLHGTIIQFLLQFLTPFLMQSTNVLQEITLGKCELGHEEINLFATCLISREVPLDKLTLIGVEDGINELALAFHDNPGLFPKKFNATLLTRIIGLD